MVPITSLVVPILVAAVLVFLASSILHMVLPLHKSDYKPVPNEAAVQDALRPFDIPPGDYMLPNAGSHAGLKDPAFLDRLNKGPVAIMTVLPNGMPGMGPQLALWFVFCCVVGVFAAYVSGRALGPGASYLEVFRFAGVTAFASYWLADLPQSIWYKRSWVTTAKNGFDGLIYALLTAGTFGWLWPR